MKPIVSGTTAERIIRAGLLAVLVSAFAIAYLWDGYGGYARDNAQQFAETLGLNPDPPPPVDPELTEVRARRLIREISQGSTIEEATAQLGQPGLQQEGNLYYLGPGGRLRLETQNGRIAEGQWQPGVHSEADISAQRWIGGVLAIFALATLGHLIRTLATRVSMDENGLKIRGKPLIGFEAMTGISVGGPGQRETVMLEYEVDGRRASAELNAYIVKELPAITAAICERKGFPNPTETPSAADPDHG